MTSTSFAMGFIMVSALFVLTLVSFFYTPHDPNLIVVANKLMTATETGGQHLLGTDQLGRDILSRIMLGSQLSFTIGFAVVLVGGFFGTIMGALAGYYGSWVDAVISKIIDVQMAFPGILIALMIIAVLGDSTANMITALSIMAVPSFARMSRSGFMKFRNADFVKAAKARGATDIRVMTRHIFPNIVQELTVTATLSFSGAIMSEAGLSYLGLGIKPPQPSFGNMLSEAQSVIMSAPWFVLMPTAFITILVMGFNLMGDGINEVIRR